jgi:hypothetical protein
LQNIYNTTTISFSHKQVRYLSYTHMSKKIEEKGQ